ncbi:hypothetical protein [Mesorhizobium sp. WSM2239]|uniref:Uncharacterized protein n=2 Tax=unclassified Mesorhizobium TaxID=325217 RepID=A0AAU8DJJ0_9HYPH
MSLVIGGPSEWVGVNNHTLPESADDHLDAARSLQHYQRRARERLKTAELHHLMGHDLEQITNLPRLVCLQSRFLAVMDRICRRGRVQNCRLIGIRDSRFEAQTCSASDRSRSMKGGNIFGLRAVCD